MASRSDPGTVRLRDGATGFGGSARRRDDPGGPAGALVPRDPHDPRGGYRPPGPCGTEPMGDRGRTDAPLAGWRCGRLELLSRVCHQRDRRVPRWFPLRAPSVGPRCAHDVLRYLDGCGAVRSRGLGRGRPRNRLPGGPMAKRPTARDPTEIGSALVLSEIEPWDRDEHEVIEAQNTIDGSPIARCRRGGRARIPPRRSRATTEWRARA